MLTYHWNGECWYLRRWSALHHLRNWLIWIGGWEEPNGEGWSLLFDGWRDTWTRARQWKSPTPVSVFGHRVTWFGWGLNVKLPGGGWLVVVWRTGGAPWRVYLSHNGTPSEAWCWISGAPREVVDACERGPCATGRYEPEDRA